MIIMHELQDLHIPPQEASTGMSSCRVLLAEDQTLIRMEVADSLRRLGWSVEECGSADEAMALLQCSAFDLVLSDIEMPGRHDGLDLARHAKILYPAIKVVLMSGGHVPHAEECGCLDLFVPKPFIDIGDMLWPLMDNG